MSGNPYKNVWNNEDKWAESQSKGMTTFVPTYAELARRYMSTSRHHLRRARRLGHTVSGVEAYEDALFYRNMAKGMLDRHHQVLRMSR